MVVMLLVMGAGAALVGYVWILVKAWTESVPWGVGVLLFSPLAFVYGVLKWEEAKMPVILMAVGVALSILGRVLQGL